MFSKIFSFIPPLSKYLQSKSIDIKDAETYLNNVYEELRQLRDSFEEIKDSSIELALSWGVEPKFQKKRLRHVKNHFDELSQNERIEDSEKIQNRGLF